MTDLIELVGAVDGILQVQAQADADYFLRVCGATVRAGRRRSASRDACSRAYRWQYIVSGVQDERFQQDPRRHDHRGPSSPHRRRARADHELTPMRERPRRVLAAAAEPNGETMNRFREIGGQSWLVMWMLLVREIARCHSTPSLTSIHLSVPSRKEIK